MEQEKSSKFIINNWDEWFRNCGALQQPLQNYESLMNDYYDKQNSKKPEGRNHAQMQYQSHHESSFFDKQPNLPAWLLKQWALRGAIVMVVLVCVSLVYTLIKANQAQTNPSFTLPVILAVLVTAGIVAIPLFWHSHGVKKLKQEMRNLEAELHDRMVYVPPKYRNAQAVGTFYEMYCNYGVVTYNQAVTACDDYLISNNMIGAYMSVMHDLPYENAGNVNLMNPSADRGLYTGGEKPADPNLPDDILSKTYKGPDDADAKLDELIGLDNVKRQVRQMKNRMNFYQGSSTERISGNHMVFLGPPGTGKTTIARILTKILYDFGYIKENKCVEIDGGYMKSPYVGQTVERASAIIRYAMGGVLFIDEAYMMLDKNSSAGSEATGVLLKAMEDNKHDFVVIFAGYEDNINRLLASNEGFASRVKTKLYFDNFSVEELAEIFHMMLKQYATNGQYQIDKDAMAMLKRHFEKELRIAGFGNARVVRNTLDALLDTHADHYMNGKVSEEKKYTIVKEDVATYLKVREKQMVEDGRNFIASRNLDSSIVSLQELKGKTKSGAKDPDKALKNLTGLSVIKDEITAMKAQFEFEDGHMESEGNHMVFVGPPGTGKTTVASIMTGYLYQFGLIQENSYLEINGDFLRGMYLGHTGKRTEAVIQYAQGMVLFIDEAYLLTSNDGTADSFGQEAIGVLLDAMEKYRKNFVVIFAGYEKEMGDFLRANSGIESRVNRTFHFTTYTPHELAQMFQRWAKANKFTVESDVWVPLQQYFKEVSQAERFGNGRFVRTLFRDVKQNHVMNYAKKLYGEDKKYVITLQDVQSLLQGSDTVLDETKG